MRGDGRSRATRGEAVLSTGTPQASRRGGGSSRAVAACWRRKIGKDGGSRQGLEAEELEEGAKGSLGGGAAWPLPREQAPALAVTERRHELPGGRGDCRPKSPRLAGAGGGVATGGRRPSGGTRGCTLVGVPSPPLPLAGSPPEPAPSAPELLLVPRPRVRPDNRRAGGAAGAAAVPPPPPPRSAAEGKPPSKPPSLPSCPSGGAGGSDAPPPDSERGIHSCCAACWLWWLLSRLPPGVSLEFIRSDTASPEGRRRDKAESGMPPPGAPQLPWEGPRWPRSSCPSSYCRGQAGRGGAGGVSGEARVCAAGRQCECFSRGRCGAAAALLLRCPGSPGRAGRAACCPPAAGPPRPSPHLATVRQHLHTPRAIRGQRSRFCCCSSPCSARHCSCCSCCGCGGGGVRAVALARRCDLPHTWSEGGRAHR